MFATLYARNAMISSVMNTIVTSITLFFVLILIEFVVGL